VIHKVGGPLGLSIVGGADHTSHPFGIDEPGVFVSKVTCDSAERVIDDSVSWVSVTVYQMAPPRCGHYCTAVASCVVIETHFHGRLQYLLSFFSSVSLLPLFVFGVPLLLSQFLPSVRPSH